jgi:hypothetical protein
MGKKHREKRQKYVDYLRAKEKENDEKEAEKEKRRQEKRQRDKASEDCVKLAVSKPTGQSATSEAKRTDEGETSIKKVRTER